MLYLQCQRFPYKFSGVLVFSKFIFHIGSGDLKDREMRVAIAQGSYPCNKYMALKKSSISQHNQPFKAGPYLKKIQLYYNEDKKYMRRK